MHIIQAKAMNLRVQSARKTSTAVLLYYVSNHLSNCIIRNFVLPELHSSILSYSIG